MKSFLLATLLILSLTSSATIVSSFACSSVKGCSPLVVTFANHSQGNINSTFWDFGNGNTSTQQNPSATYTNAGVYTVTLIVTNGNDIDTMIQHITVFSAPSVNFSVDRTTACPNDSVHFLNQVTAGSAPISKYAWGFGNGIASSDTNAIYQYPQSGNYDVTLVVQDTNRCDAHLTKTAYITIWPKPSASFVASPQLTCAASQLVTFTSQSTGNGLTYSWLFGDSTTSTTASPTHLYSYGKFIAKMIVTNNDGCIDSMKQKIDVINVKADFIATKTTICAGETVHFLDQSPMQGTMWHWNFGDGSISNKENPAKVFSQTGVYSVTFVVSDNICHDSATKVAYITVTQGFSASFTADQQNSCTTPFQVHFTGNVPGGVSLAWSFGDGNSSDSLNPTNTYTSAEMYTVSLIAVDSSGCTVVATAPGFINTSKPWVNFYCDTTFCLGTPVGFANRTYDAVRYLWNFGDGDTSTQINPTHIYNHYGRYTVSLTAWNSIGCDSTLVKYHIINIDSTKVGFSVNSTFSKCPPLVSVFTSHATENNLKYLWNFGDGYTDTAANPTHIYFHPGVYTVKLTGTNRYGCTNTFVDSNLIVVQGPSGNFTISPSNGCIPVTVNFNANVSANTENVICDLGNGILYTDSLHFNYTYNTANTFHPKFILTDHIGCSVSYSPDSITTHALPVLTLHDTAICAGSALSIKTANTTFGWVSRSISACDTCFSNFNICDTCNTISLYPADTTVYKFTTTNTFGCTASKTIKVNVAALPAFNKEDSIKLCKNASVQLNVVKSATNVSWAPATYLNKTNIAAPTCMPASSITYTVTASNQLGCKVTQTVPVRVYSEIPLIALGDTAVCAGAWVNLFASVTDSFFKGVTYTWNNASYLNIATIANPTAIIGATTETFKVTANSGNCPAATASVTIAVNPSASVKLPDNIITSPFVETTITPVSGDLVSYQWTAKDSLICAECATATIVPTESQVVYLNGKNQYGCSAKDSMLLHIVNCDPSAIFVPNTFTPNGDGTNDKLYVRSKTLGQLEYFRLFNRWGAIVFESKNIAAGWDGTINGRLAEEGVYVYEISGKCENGYDVTTSGTVTLIR